MLIAQQGNKQIDCPAVKAFGKNVKHYRELLGMSKFKLCAEAGLEMKRLLAIEGGFHNPTLLTIAKIAEALGVSVSSLFSEAIDETDVFQLSDLQPYFNQMSRREQMQAVSILKLQIELSKAP